MPTETADRMAEVLRGARGAAERCGESGVMIDPDLLPWTRGSKRSRFARSVLHHVCQLFDLSTFIFLELLNGYSKFFARKCMCSLVFVHHIVDALDWFAVDRPKSLLSKPISLAGWWVQTFFFSLVLPNDWMDG